MLFLLHEFVILNSIQTMKNRRYNKEGKTGIIPLRNLEMSNSNYETTQN